jgi:signal transduction histidine kinase/ActR/RegA family two-component response regulator
VKREILIIDDDPDYRESIKHAFNKEDYIFFEASSVLEGIGIVETNSRIRVVLLDLNLSGESGKEFLEKIKDRVFYYRIIVLTAYEDLLPAEIAASYKVFNYLPKINSHSIQSTQPIRFSVDQAFKDIEREFLREKVSKLIAIQEKINSNRPLNKKKKNAIRSLNETLNLICQAVCELTEARSCHIRVYDFKTGEFVFCASTGLSESIKLMIKEPKRKDQFLSGIVVSMKEPLLINDAQTDPIFINYKNHVFSTTKVTAELRELFEKAGSSYLLPISTGIFGEQVDAVLNIASNQKNFFSTEKCKLIQEFVTQAAIAITKCWLETKRREAHQDYGRISKMLGEISNKLRDEAGMLDNIFDIAIDSISEIVNPEIVSILMFDEGAKEIKNQLELRGNKKIKLPELEETYQPGQCLTGSVFSDKKTIWLPNPKQNINPTKDKRYDSENKEEYEGYIPHGELKHYLGVPIKVGQQIRGVLRAINKKSKLYGEADDKSHGFCILERGFSEDCKNALEITASHLAVAIQNAELINQLDGQVKQLETLNSVSQFISSEIDIDIDRLLELTITQTAEVMHAEICMLFLKNKTGDRFVLQKCYGMNLVLLQGASYEKGEGVTGQVAESGKSRLIAEAGKNDGKYDSIILDFLRKRHGVDKSIESLMTVPILVRGKTLGIIKVINKLEDHLQYNKADLKYFEIFASWVGVALEHAEIYHRGVSKAERSALYNLVRAVVHEINNTSGLIPINVQIIKAVLPSLDENVIGMLDTIEDSANQAVRFANLIAGFSSNRLGKKETQNINQVIEKAVNQLIFDLKEYPNFNNISTELTLTKSPILCEIHEGPFIQVVRNIVINAYQAMEKTEHGQLEITSGIDHSQNIAIIRFTDNGRGIREEHKSKIFEIEFSTKKNGNGIGLWLVKTHLEEIGGTISFESKENQGTTFTIKLPLVTSSSYEK